MYSTEMYKGKNIKKYKEVTQPQHRVHTRKHENLLNGQLNSRVNSFA